MSEHNHRVVTHALAFLSAGTVDLCEGCLASNDHGFILGPVERELHRGRCAAPKHYEGHNREHFDASLEKRLTVLAQSTGRLESVVDNLAADLEQHRQGVSQTFDEMLRALYELGPDAAKPEPAELEAAVDEACAELVERGQATVDETGRYRLTNVPAPPLQTLLAILCAAYIRGHFGIAATHAELAATLGVSERTVRRWLATLRDRFLDNDAAVRREHGDACAAIRATGEE